MRFVAGPVGVLAGGFGVDRRAGEPDDLDIAQRQRAGAMDAGDALTARVSSLSDNKNPWQRLAFEVFAEL